MSSLCSTEDRQVSLCCPALMCQGQEAYLFYNRDNSLQCTSNALWHLVTPIVCLCDVEKLDSLRRVRSILTRKTHCTINISVPLSRWLFTLFSCPLRWRVLQVALCRCLWQWQIRSFFTVLISNEPCICLLLNMNLNSRINKSSNWDTHLCMISFQSWSC